MTLAKEIADAMNNRFSAYCWWWLGDQRYAQMYPPSNETAETLRKDLRAITLPAEVSFDALVDIQNQWNERRREAQARLLDAKTRITNCEDELRKLNDTLEMEFERLLGTNGYAAAIKESDARYQEMKRHAQDWLLDTSEIDHVFRTLQYYDKATEEYLLQVQALEASGDTVNRDAANQNLQRFARQTEEGLQSYLGQEHFNLLKGSKVLRYPQ